MPGGRACWIPLRLWKFLRAIFPKRKADFLFHQENYFGKMLSKRSDLRNQTNRRIAPKARQQRLAMMITAQRALLPLAGVQALQIR
jgi:hypothetical protein